MPKVKKSDDVAQYTQANKQTLETHIGQLLKTPAGQLNVAMTLGLKGKDDLERFFLVQMVEHLRESINNEWPEMVKEFGGTKQFRDSKQTVLERFMLKLKANESLLLLKELFTSQYDDKLSSFIQERGAFSSAFMIFESVLAQCEQDRVIDEAKKAKNKAHADAKAAKEAIKVAKKCGDAEAEKATRVQAEAQAEKARAQAAVAKAEEDRKAAEAAKAEAEAREFQGREKRDRWWAKAFETLKIVISIVVEFFSKR